MKLTRTQLRKLILEGYRELQNQQAERYKSGELVGVSGPISKSPRVRYYTALRAYLYHDQGIDSPYGRGGFDYTLNNGHDLKVARSRSWPSGFSLIRQSLWNASMSSGGLAPFSIHFAVTGNPEIDAEFIARLCALSDDDFLRISAITRGSARVGSWESEILPGYPHKFIGL